MHVLLEIIVLPAASMRRGTLPCWAETDSEANIFIYELGAYLCPNNGPSIYGSYSYLLIDRPLRQNYMRSRLRAELKS